MEFLIGQHLDTRTSHKGDDQFGAANRWRRPYSANTVGFTTWIFFKIMKTNLLNKLYVRQRSPGSLIPWPVCYLLMRLRKKKYQLFYMHLQFCCRSQNCYKSLRTDDSSTGCHVVIWSSFACAKGFRLHFHNTQLYSGECPIETLKPNQSRLFNLHSSNRRENPLQWLDDTKKMKEN